MHVRQCSYYAVPSPWRDSTNQTEVYRITPLNHYNYTVKHYRLFSALGVFVATTRRIKINVLLAAASIPGEGEDDGAIMHPLPNKKYRDYVFLPVFYIAVRATGRHLPYMGSPSVTCYPTQVNTPRLNPFCPNYFNICYQIRWSFFGTLGKNG